MNKNPANAPTRTEMLNFLAAHSGPVYDFDFTDYGTPIETWDYLAIKNLYDHIKDIAEHYVKVHRDWHYVGHEIKERLRHAVSRFLGLHAHQLDDRVLFHQLKHLHGTSKYPIQTTLEHLEKFICA